MIHVPILFYVMFPLWSMLYVHCALCSGHLNCFGYILQTIRQQGSMRQFPLVLLLLLLPFLSVRSTDIGIALLLVLLLLGHKTSLFRQFYDKKVQLNGIDIKLHFFGSFKTKMCSSVERLAGNCTFLTVLWPKCTAQWKGWPATALFWQFYDQNVQLSGKAGRQLHFFDSFMTKMCSSVKRLAGNCTFLTVLWPKCAV